MKSFVENGMLFGVFLSIFINRSLIRISHFNFILTFMEKNDQELYIYTECLTSITNNLSETINIVLYVLFL